MRDEIAIFFMGYYSNFLTVDLFLFALKNNNLVFMQKSLLLGAFEKAIFSDDKVIMRMLGYLEDGSKTNFVMNVLLLSDVVLWK